MKNLVTLILSAFLVSPAFAANNSEAPTQLTQTMWYAIKRNDVQTVKWVLSHDEFVVREADLLLHNAIWYNSDTPQGPEMVQVLLADKRVNPNQIYTGPVVYKNRWSEGETGLTPLMAAAMFGYPDTVALLLKDPRVLQGLNIKARDGNDALKIAKRALRYAKKDGPDKYQSPLADYEESVRLLEAAQPKNPIFGGLFN